MDINIDENQDTSQSDEMNPINLVTRIKHEAEEPPASLEEYGEISDFVNSFRKRRRGRGRYIPYISNHNFEQTRTPFNCSTNGVENSKKIDALYPSTSMNCKPFSCPNCKIHFQNRDSLAMHMMESVRLEGCQSKTSKEKVSSSINTSDPLSVSRAPFTAHFENGCRDKSCFSSNISSTNFHELSRDRMAPTCFLCKVCGDTFLNLDSLAMHMFVHVQQETNSKDSISPPKSNPLISVSPMVPLPENLWNNQLNSSLYFKSFLSTSILDKQKSQNPKISSSNTVESISSQATNKYDNLVVTDPQEQVIERNCRSAPISNVIACGGLAPKEYVDISKPSKGSINHVKEPSSPGNAKESFDSDIQFLSKLHRCNHCKILFEDLTTYCLHMGLHNVNNPWQCNMCGKKCIDLHDFTVHSLHF